MSEAALNKDALAPCPFCETALRHVTSWAKSFQPNRLYHEYHHAPVAQCPACPRGHMWNFSDDPAPRQAFIAAWNRRGSGPIGVLFRKIKQSSM